MKKKRINFKKLGIQALMDQYGYTYEQAKTIWGRAYKQAWYHAKKHNVKDINIAREVYSSMFYRGNQLFEITKDLTATKSRISEQFVHEDDVQKAFIESRFKGMAESYKEVAKILHQYTTGKISYTKFKEKIAKFKITNQAYLKAGS